MTSEIDPYMGIETLAAAFGKKTLSPSDVLEVQLARISRHNPSLNAFTSLNQESARKAAAASTQRWLAGRPLGPLDGVTFVVKDNMMVAGLPFRRGSLTTPPSNVEETSPAVARCLEAGAVFLGLTTMPEFGAGPVTISPLTGITRNPWDPGKQAGGSSGGASVAVAAGFCSFALGSDAGGSIRIPAALCGIVGMKPTGFRVPMYPSSVAGALSCIGPLTHNVADAAIAMQVICQGDPRDPMALIPDNVDYTTIVAQGVQGLRIGWSPDLGFAPKVHPQIEQCLADKVQLFESLGARVDNTHPGYDDPIEAYLVLLKAAYQHSLRALSPEKRALLGPALQEILAEEPKVAIVDYLSALDACQLMGRKSSAFHEQYDLLVTPTVATPAFDADRSYPADYEAYANRRAWTPFTSLFNLTQQPAISIPIGLTHDGLPIGMQIIGPRGADAKVMRAARAIEAAINTRFRPSLAGKESHVE